MNIDSDKLEKATAVLDQFYERDDGVDTMMTKEDMIDVIDGLLRHFELLLFVLAWMGMDRLLLMSLDREQEFDLDPVVMWRLWQASFREIDALVYSIDFAEDDGIELQDRMEEIPIVKLET